MGKDSVGGGGTTTSGAETLEEWTQLLPETLEQKEATAGREREAGIAAFHAPPSDLLPVPPCFFWTVAGVRGFSCVEPFFFPGESFPFPLCAIAYP